jgi:hypothetical protein
LRLPGRPRLPDELLVLALLASGGGVGGNMLRFSGGSECCRVLAAAACFWPASGVSYEKLGLCSRWLAGAVLLSADAITFALPR